MTNVCFLDTEIRKEETPPTIDGFEFEGINELFLALNLSDIGILDDEAFSQNADEGYLAYKIVEHFGNRTKPYYFYDEKEKSKLMDAIKGDVTYLKSVVNEADKLIRYLPYLWGSYADFDNPDVWNHLIWSPNYSTYGSMLNRMEWLVSCGQAYWITGDEKYADFAVKILKKWIETNPLEITEPIPRGKGDMGLPWGSTLDIGIRLQSFCELFQLIRCYEGFDTETYIQFLHSVYQHLTLLEKQEQKFCGGNWQTQECEGIVQASLMFPEFKKSQDWYQLAMARFGEHLATPFTLDDGS